MKHGAIVISGLPGAGKSTLISRLSERTGWPVHSIGDLFRAKLKALKETGEVRPELKIENWWPTIPAEEQVRINEELLGLVNKGEIIADTRYAFYLQGADSNPFFVFLAASREIRAERGLKSPSYAGKTKDDVVGILKSREEDEGRIGFQLFGRDYRDQNDYHLVINSDKMSINEEAGIILGYLR